MATSDDLRMVFAAARPLIEQWLDVAEQIGALRDVAASKGLDWSQLKGLLKAQIQDERDDAGDGKRVRRIVEKAEFASAYADMLGLANMNENIFSHEVPDHDAETGEITEPNPQPSSSPDADKAGDIAPLVSPATNPDGDVPAFLLRERKPLRPLCLNPEECAGYGSHTCHRCLKAAGQSEAA